MFHLKPNPSPPSEAGRETPGQAVDSSAAMITPGACPWVTVLSSRRNAIASKSSLPPYWFGTHSPGARE